LCSVLQFGLSIVMILSNWFRKLNSTTESSLWTLLFYCFNFILQCAKKCLTKLTKNQYEVLYLKYVNELSLKEMANILNIKENAIKQRLYGAKQKLSTLIKEELENE
ncbi:MAG: sigma-70 family RNA polymerase sigma factor, partial [Acutalibacteraceae bacterium]|nr:sigma-70 family RNA polymerase sigma factor [Acutalibacteraceae bacterium]